MTVGAGLNTEWS